MRRNFLFLLIFFPLWAFSQSTEEIDARLLKLSGQLRCLVCQNQSIADSDADLATDLKNEIRTMLEKGDSDDQILNFMTERYGDFVRYNPPVQTNTLILWLAPVLFFTISCVAFVVYLKKRNQCIATSSNDEEKRKIASALLEARNE